MSDQDENSITQTEDEILQSDFEEPKVNRFLSSPTTDPNLMRNKYLSKLTQEKVWLTPQEKPKSHQSIIIFDWDDTLL